MKEGDYIVAIGEHDVKWFPHEDVVELIKAAGDALTLKLVTPMDKSYSRVRHIFQDIFLALTQSLFYLVFSLQSSKGNKKGSVSGSSSSSSGVSSNHSWTTGNQSVHSTLTSERHIKKLTWNPFRKHSTPSLDNLLLR